MMIECYKIQSGWYVVNCSSCQMETYHEDADAAHAEYKGHMEMHEMAQDLNRYFGLVGASIAYKPESHFQVGNLN